MARKDLLAEAIADAKAVKETALANAKLALEEAFTPKLQSMISAKLAEEMDDELEEEETDEMAHEEEAEEMAHEMAHEDEAEEGYHEDAHEDEVEEGAHEDETEEAYHEEEDAEEAYHEEEEDDLDLESIIRELEMDDEELTEEDELDEDDDDDDDDEEIDLEEVINALKEMAHEDEIEEMGHEKEEGMHDENLEDELEEAYKTIESLQATINEVNLLNAKLLYTNKLFRTFELNESQKVKVLENFDRTSSVREVKLVFTTLAENLNVAKNKKTVVKEGYASKTIKSSAPKKEIITETNNLASRWKKLAGLK